MPRASRTKPKRKCHGIVAPLPRDKRKSRREYKGLRGDKLLGSGGFGTTVMRRSKKGKHIAVKLVSRKYKEKEAEIQQLAYRASPHVARIFSHCHLDKGAGLVTMEVVSGGEVDFSRSLSTPVLKRATLQLMTAMAHLHESGIYHRDLKEENILFDRDPKVYPDIFNVKIIDFGLTCLSNEKCEHEGAGTREMMPPETYIAWSYKKAFDPALLEIGKNRHAMHDVWSIGIMLAVKCQGEYCASSTGMNFPSVTNRDFHSIFEKRCERTMKKLQGYDRTAKNAQVQCFDPVECILKAYTIEIEGLRVNFEAAIAAPTVPSMRWAGPLLRAMLEPNVFKRPNLHEIIQMALAANVFETENAA